MDHIIDLPTSNSYNTILVVIDRLTKMGYFIPAKKTDTATDQAKYFIDTIVRLHGLPTEIITDKGTLFKNRF